MWIGCVKQVARGWRYSISRLQIIVRPDSGRRAKSEGGENLLAFAAVKNGDYNAVSVGRSPEGKQSMLTPPDQGPVEIDREPFSPEGPQSKWFGGPRWALLGCGALILLLGIGSVVFLLKAKDLFGWMMNELEAQVMESLPANITEPEIEELTAAFDAVVEAVQEDRANVVELQELQRMLRESLGSGPKRFSREEVQSLIEALDRVSGRNGGEDADRPEPERVGATQSELPPSAPQPAG